MQVQGNVWFNLLVILCAIFGAYLLMLDRYFSGDKKQSRIILGLFCGVAAMACMSLPIVHGNNGEPFLWDLRWVPYVIALLYGGYLSGGIALILLLGYRWLLGGVGAFVTVVLVALLFYAFIPLAGPACRRMNRTQKLITGAALAVGSYAVSMGGIWLYFAYREQFSAILRNGPWLYTRIGLFNVAGVLLSVLIIEIITDSVNAREMAHRMVLNSMDAIATILDGQWVYMNPAGFVLFEAKPRDLLNKPVLDYLLPRHHEAFRAWQPSDGEEEQRPSYGPVEFEWRSAKGNPIYSEAVAIPCRIDHRQGLQIILRDISERKHAEELMIQSERLSVAGQLAAGIAHEIRNPITSIMGFIQLMREGKQAKTEYYDIILDEMHRVDTILEGLLVLAKPQYQKQRVMPLGPILDGVTMLLGPEALMKNIEIVLNDPYPEKVIVGDENLIRQVFVNLVKNAIEVMNGGGRILLEIRLARGGIEVDVQDQGGGMDAEQLARIGTPFYSTKDYGTGLGVAISYRIVESHLGHIKVRSEKGEGSTFTVWLPLAPDPDA